MKKIKIELSYDGGRYYGWQRQSENRITVQGEVEKALQKLFKNDNISICASGRTDAGVHAYAQIAHSWVPDKVESMPLLRGLNGLVPKDIGIHSVHIVNDDFHAIASSEKKTYIYKIYNSLTPFALHAKYRLWVRDELDLDKLNQWSKQLTGTLDFKSFMTSGSPVPSTVRTVFNAEWFYEDSNKENIVFKISGNGFLKQMVRNIVGTLLHLHKKEGNEQDLLQILNAKDRAKAFKSAPAHALYLKSVQYPKAISKSLKSL